MKAGVKEKGNWEAVARVVRRPRSGSVERCISSVSFVVLLFFSLVPFLLVFFCLNGE